MKILKYIFISSILLSLPHIAPAQEQSETAKPWEFKGVSVSADLFGYIGRIMNDYTSSAVAVSANFGNRFFPVLEVGYGTPTPPTKQQPSTTSRKHPISEQASITIFFTKRAAN